MVDEQQVYCPHCGEEFTALVDASAGDSEYIEDCEECGHPLEFIVMSNGDSILDLKIVAVED